MKTKFIYIIILLLICSCNNKTEKTSNVSSSKNKEPLIELSNKQPIEKRSNNNRIAPIDVNKKVRTNEKGIAKTIFNNKYGITYSIPKHWKINIPEYKSVNLKGKITSYQTEYIDVRDNSKINFIFYPDKEKKLILDKNAKYINISEKKAIKKVELLEFNGKGTKMKNSTKRLIISLLSDRGFLNIILNSKSKISETTFDEFISDIKIN